MRLLRVVIWIFGVGFVDVTGKKCDSVESVQLLSSTSRSMFLWQSMYDVGVLIRSVQVALVPFVESVSVVGIALVKGGDILFVDILEWVIVNVHVASLA